MHYISSIALKSLAFKCTCKNTVSHMNDNQEAWRVTLHVTKFTYLLRYRLLLFSFLHVNELVSPQGGGVGGGEVEVSIYDGRE